MFSLIYCVYCKDIFTSFPLLRSLPNAIQFISNLNFYSMLELIKCFHRTCFSSPHQPTLIDKELLFSEMTWEVKWLAQEQVVAEQPFIQYWFQMQSSPATLLPKSSSQRVFLILSIKHVFKRQPLPGRCRLEMATEALTSTWFHQPCPPASGESLPLELLWGQRQGWEGSASSWTSDVYFGTLGLGNSINSATLQWGLLIP